MTIQLGQRHPTELDSSFHPCFQTLHHYRKGSPLDMMILNSGVDIIPVKAFLIVCLYESIKTKKRYFIFNEVFYE